MNPTEKHLRYQAQAQLSKLRREGAKPTLIERVRRSITGQRDHQQKGKTFGPRNKGF